jgi:hypothetical protein
VTQCTTDITGQSEPGVLIDFQRDSDTIRTGVTTTGKVRYGGGAQDFTAVVTIEKMEIAPGGEVEFDLVGDKDVVDAYKRTHRWHVEAHIVGTCQQ